MKWSQYFHMIFILNFSYSSGTYVEIQDDRTHCKHIQHPADMQPLFSQIV